jgi:hypothetical protein
LFAISKSFPNRGESGLSPGPTRKPFSGSFKKPLIEIVVALAVPDIERRRTTKEENRSVFMRVPFDDGCNSHARSITDQDNLVCIKWFAPPGTPRRNALRANPCVGIAYRYWSLLKEMTVESSYTDPVRRD